MEAERETVSGQAFNIGSDGQNYKIGDLAELVAGSLTSRPQIEWYGDPDKRSYRVSFEKAQKLLGYEAATDPAKATKEIESSLTSSKIDEDPRTITLNWYKHILNEPAASKTVSLRGAVL